MATNWETLTPRKTFAGLTPENEEFYRTKTGRDNTTGTESYDLAEEDVFLGGPKELGITKLDKKLTAQQQEKAAKWETLKPKAAPETSWETLKPKKKKGMSLKDSFFAAGREFEGAADMILSTPAFLAKNLISKPITNVGNAAGGAKAPLGKTNKAYEEFDQTGLGGFLNHPLQSMIGNHDAMKGTIGNEVFGALGDKIQQGADYTTDYTKNPEGGEAFKQAIELLMAGTGAKAAYHGAKLRQITKQENLIRETQAAKRAADIKARRDALGQRNSVEQPPLEYEHTTAPHESPVLQRPETPDHNGLNYEGGIDYPILGEKAFIEAGGTPEAYAYYKQMELPFNKERPAELSLSPEQTKAPMGQSEFAYRRINPRETLTPEQQSLDFEPAAIPKAHPMGGVGKKQGGAVDIGDPRELLKFLKNKTLPARDLDNNASGESAASMEAISRNRADANAGIKYNIVDPERKSVTPLKGVDIADTRAPQGSSIIKTYPDGRKEIVENNSRMSNEGLLARSELLLRDNVSDLITKPVRDFHKSMMSDIRTKAEEMAKMTKERVESYDKWEFKEGDRIRSPHSGRTITITGRSWNTQADTPQYKGEYLTENGLQKGTFRAEASNPLNTKDRLQGPGIHGYEKLTGPSRMGGVGKKQGGAVLVPEAVVNVIKNLVTREPKKATRPGLIPQLRQNLPATMRKDQTVKSLAEELLVPRETGEGFYRTTPDMLPAATIGTPFQPGMHRVHPLRRFVYGKILKMNQDALNLAEDWMYGTEFKGFKQFRTIPIMERTNKGGLTEIERLVKTDVKSADNIFSTLSRYEGIKDPTMQDLINEGLSERQAQSALAIRSMLDKIQEATGVQKKAGYLPHMWTGDYRAWVTDKTTGEAFVFGVNNKFSSLKFNKSKYDVTVTKVDVKNPLADADFNALFNVLDHSKVKEALQSRLKDLVTERGFMSHNRKQDGIGGYLGGFEKTPKARAEARLKSLKMYVGSASRHVASEGPKKDMVDLSFNKDLAEAYPTAYKQAQLDWDLANGDIYSIGKGIDLVADKITEGVYGGSVNDLKVINRAVASLGTRAKVLMLNVGNMVAQRLQPFLAIQELNVEPGSVSKAALQGMKDYLLIKNDRSFDHFVVEMEKRGVISTSFMRELQNPTAAERRSLGEDSYLYKTTPKEKLAGGAKELTLQTELERTEIQTRLQAALIAKRFYENAGYKGIEVFDRVEDFVQRGMGDYSHSGKAPIFTNSGLVGDLVSPLSTFSTNELNKLLSHMKGMAKGSEKLRHAKGFFGYSLASLTLAGLSGASLVKVSDSFIELYNKINPESPMRTSSERILASDMPEAAKVGWVSAVTREATPHGVNVQNSMTMPVTMGGISTSGPFGLTFGWSLADLGASISSDLLTYGKITDESLIKAEKVAPPMIGGMMDAYRTENNDMMSTTNKEQGRYERSPEENDTRKFGLRSLDEAKQMATDRAVIVEKQRQGKARGVLLQSVVKDLINDKDPSDIEIEKYIELGGSIDRIQEGVRKYETDKITTEEERIFLDGLSKEEMMVEQAVEDFRENNTVPEGEEVAN